MFGPTPKSLLGAFAFLVLVPAATALADALLETSPSSIVYGQHQAHFGFAVASAGDVNRDGYDDVIVSADLYDNGQTDEGGAWVYHGSAAGADTMADWTGEGNVNNALYGTAVAPAGDVNGDLYDDIIVGAPLIGRAYVYAGSAGGLATTPLWTGVGGGSYGIAVSSAGDVNDDGFSDVIVGAMHYSGGLPFEGKAFLYLGSAAGPATTPIWTVEGNQNGARLGYSVSAAGDVNADGYDDVLVGAPDFDAGEENEGQAYLYLGSLAGLATSPVWTAESNQAFSAFGLPVAAAGDVNGDGYADVIIASFLYDSGQTANNGRAWFYLGSAAGLGVSPSWTYDGQDGNELGISLGSAGDADGDGYDEVLIGVPHYQNPEYVEGAAIAFRGSSAGPSLTPDWIVEGNLPPPGQPWGGPHVGWASGPAGDVNGDGHDDVIVGAPFSHCPEQCGPIPGWASVYDGVGITSAMEAPQIVPALRLLPNRPNPFGPPTTISYALPSPGQVRLSIIDARGRQLITLVDQIQQAGEHTLAWDGRDARHTPVSAGIYFTRLEALGQVRTGKIAFTR